jgi:ABC-type transporter MlaC component
MSRLRNLMNTLAQFHIGLCRLILPALCLTAFFVVLQLAAQNAPAAPAQKLVFDDQAATKLLSQLTQGLENANQKQVLSVFDFSHMNDGQRFQQQLISFVAHAESIRLHLNLLHVNSDSGKGSAEADIEMEIEPRDGTLPVRKQARLNFSALSSAGGWKFVDVQPRGFFSNNPGQ